MIIRPAPVRTPEELRAWRAKHHLSQHKLADLLDITWVTVSRWENGHVAIPRTVQLALRYLDHGGLTQS